jgi:hypothetical protein
MAGTPPTSTLDDDVGTMAMVIRDERIVLGQRTWGSGKQQSYDERHFTREI